MKKIMAFVGIIALGLSLFAGGAMAATYGKHIIPGKLVGFTSKFDTEIYQWTDGKTTCYIAYFGKGGATMDCK